MNPIEDLHKMLDKAGIPHEFKQEKYSNETIKTLDLEHSFYGFEKGQWIRNQVVFWDPKREGTDNPIELIDAVWQYGSYGDSSPDLVETWFRYGSDEDGEPRLVTIEEAFEMFKKAYEENKETE